MIFLFLIVGSDFTGKNHGKVNLFLRGYVMSINTENKIATRACPNTHTYSLGHSHLWSREPEQVT